MSEQTPTAVDPFAAARFDFFAPVAPAQDLGQVHFLAIGGAGVSAVARIMLERGIRVSGTDAADVPALASLRKLGASCHVGFEAAHQSEADTVVMSSAIRDDNPELVAARERGVPVLHRSQGLASLLAGRRTVAVAGANGKTTTSSMVTVAVRAAGLDPSFALGGEIASLGTNAHHGASDVFVVEADESDGSFVAYRPEVALVTNVQPDHLDFYGTFEAVQAAYAAFVDTIRPGGLLVACADDIGSRELAEAVSSGGRRVCTYGTEAGADVRVESMQLHGTGSRAQLVWGQERHELTLQVPGRHNVLNAVGAFAACVVGLGLPAEPVLRGLADFGGTRRRFEHKGTVAGVQVVDDYAHNVGKVAAVTSTAAAIAHDRSGRLIAVFQPHLFSRTRDFADGFGRGLALADIVVVMPIYAAREDPVPGVTAELVAEATRQAARATSKQVDVHHVEDASQVAPLVAQVAGAGDLVLTIGAGDVTRQGPAILAALKDRAG